MSSTLNDADLLALTVWTEAQNQSPDGMAAIMRVIQNRMRMHYQSDGTVPGTCLHHNAFSAFGYDFVHGAYHTAPDAYTPQRLNRMLTAAQPTPSFSKCAKVVIAVQAGHYVGEAAYDRLTPDTVLYDNPAISHPPWANATALVTAIGAHSFFRDLTWHDHGVAEVPSPPNTGVSASLAAWSQPGVAP